MYVHCTQAFAAVNKSLTVCDLFFFFFHKQNYNICRGDCLKKKNHPHAGNFIEFIFEFYINAKSENINNPK